MRYLRSLTLLVLGSIFVGGCNSTEPTGPSLTFSSRIVFGIRTVEPTINPDGADLLLQGVYQTPATNYSVFADLDVPGSNQLRVGITAASGRPGASVAVQHFYNGRISGLATGRYDLTVLYVFIRDNLPPDTTVMLRQSFTVR